MTSTKVGDGLDYRIWRVGYRRFVGYPALAEATRTAFMAIEFHSRYLYLERTYILLCSRMVITFSAKFVASLRGQGLGRASFSAIRALGKDQLNLVG